ncbi:MAG TPA: sulfite exporter TauE/SafE family protein [Gallionellaceae bacterium]
MEWFAAYLLLGAAVGLFGGMFGIGGGTLLVPVLLFLFSAQHFPAEYAMHLALGTAMANIVFTAIASMLKHHQHGAVNWQVVRRITPGILLGTALGAAFASIISPRMLGMIFAFFVLFAAAQILLDVRPHASRQLPGAAGLTLTGVFTGWLSTLVSIGGGTIVVPFLVWCNVPLRNAIGTSAAIGFPVAVGGTLGYIVAGMGLENLPAPHLGYVFLPALLGTAITSVITAPMGAWAAHHMPVHLLRKLFAVLLLALAVKLLLRLL